MSSGDEKSQEHAVKANVDEKQVDAEAGSEPSCSDIDPKAEAKLLRKLDITIYPILFIVYMMSFLDRINISNARIQGLTEDIDLSGNRFNIALFVGLLSRRRVLYNTWPALANNCKF